MRFRGPSGLRPAAPSEQAPPEGPASSPTTGPSLPPFVLHAGLDGLDLAQRFRHPSSSSAWDVERDIVRLLRAADIGSEPSSRSKRQRTRGLALDGFEVTIVPVRGREFELLYTVEPEALHVSPRATYSAVEGVNRAILAGLAPGSAPSLEIVALTIHVDFGNVALAQEDMARFHLRGSGNRRAYEFDGRRGAFSGFTFRKPGWMRLYCKSGLIRQQPSTRYMLDFYGGYTGEVWRIEAQFGRAQLRRARHASAAELLNLFRKRLHALTFRMPLAPGARTRSDRRDLDPIWNLAREAVVVFPWDAPPSLPALRPQSDAARRTQGERHHLTGLSLLLDPARTPPDTLTPDALPDEAARHVREFVEREPERAWDLIRRFRERHNRLGAGRGPKVADAARGTLA